MEAVIFDLDGTLIDSMEVWERADTILLRRYGIMPDEEYAKKITTLNFTQGVNYILSRYAIEASPNEIMEQLICIVEQYYYNKIKLKKGVKELLEALRRKNIKMVIATSCIASMCEAVLAQNKIRDYFADIVFAEEKGYQKAEPYIYEEAASRIGTEIKKCVVVEDVPHAASGAKKSGALVFGVYDAYSASLEAEMRRICDRYEYSISGVLDYF